MVRIVRVEGVLRVQADDACALRSPELDQRFQIGVIADPPIPPRAHGVQLRGHAPHAPLTLESGRQVAACRHHRQQSRGERFMLRVKRELVVPGRQREPKLRLDRDAHRGIDGCRAALCKRARREFRFMNAAMLFLYDPAQCLHQPRLVEMQSYGPGGCAFVQNHDSGHDLAPARGQRFLQTIRRCSIVRRVDAHRIENGAQRRGRSTMQAAPDVMVFEVYCVRAGKLQERVMFHTHAVSWSLMRLPSRDDERVGAWMQSHGTQELLLME